MRKSILASISGIIVLLLLPFYSFSPISAAPFGNFIVFNGGTVNSQIQNPLSPQQVDLEVWIRPYMVSGERQLLTISDNSQTNYKMGINGGSLLLFYRFGANSSRTIVSGSLVQNVWQKVKVSISSSGTKLFINDNQISNASGATALKPVGSKITLGNGFSGEMDQLIVSVNSAAYIIWNFDQSRGELSASDTSGNNINGILNGGDIKIHYFGSAPTPPRFVLPTLPSIGRISPPAFPTNATISPTTAIPQPTSASGTSWDRASRPQLPR